MEIRNFKVDDAAQIDELAVSAFSQYQHYYDDWPGMADALRRFSSLADSMKIIVAIDNDKVVGAVGYMPAQAPKADFYPNNTPVMRLLVVDPNYRGRGIGKRLAEACLDCARRDGCTTMALHTSEIMTVALPMYRRLGFTRIGDAPDIRGVKYGVYQVTL